MTDHDDDGIHWVDVHLDDDTTDMVEVTCNVCGIIGRAPADDPPPTDGYAFCARCVIDAIEENLIRSMIDDPTAVIDKTGWPDGPWMTEPDRIEWTHPTSGYPCLFRRSNFGIWYGYVAVPDTHPLYGCDSIDSIDVHGGITYTGAWVCHRATRDNPDHHWWFGFDCGHPGDVIPAFLHILDPRPESEYRSLAYVLIEVDHLADQLYHLAQIGRGL